LQLNRIRPDRATSVSERCFFNVIEAIEILKPKCKLKIGNAISLLFVQSLLPMVGAAATSVGKIAQGNLMY
jgi:hypothetical protein